MCGWTEEIFWASDWGLIKDDFHLLAKINYGPGLSLDYNGKKKKN